MEFGNKKLSQCVIPIKFSFKGVYKR